MTELTGPEKEALARTNSNIIDVIALGFHHSTLPSPIRVVQGDDNISFTLPADALANAGESVTFEAADMGVPEENLDGEPDSRLRLEMRGLSGAIIGYLSAAVDTFESVKVEQYLLTYNVVGKTVVTSRRHANLEMRSADLTMTGLVLDCGFTNDANRELKV